MEVRTYRRKVIVKLATRAVAEQCARDLAASYPNHEYVVEYTPVATQREQWRVVHMSDVPEGTPDVHPYCESIRNGQAESLRGDYGDDYRFNY